MGRDERRRRGFLTPLSLSAPAVPPLRQAPVALPLPPPHCPTVMPPRRSCHSRRAPTAPPLPLSYCRQAHEALSISLAMRIKREEKVPRKRYVDAIWNDDQVNSPRKCHGGQNRRGSRFAMVLKVRGWVIPGFAVEGCDSTRHKS
ncbi:hypothetical protein [Oryza sativa Japonica Group]|uniref:Uncharacterized protein P0424A08.14 n=1 Tax=Oryza sativa subsp. japonica TaxID=39947 RepID=Q5NBM9_ORYSJ|nr:hypothetical protein [Oryza sativa Japonica Group]